MADAPIVHIGENSPEHIAYRLMRDIAVIENRPIVTAREIVNRADRKWLLDTYAECLEAVRFPEARRGHQINNQM